MQQHLYGQCRTALRAAPHHLITCVAWLFCSLDCCVQAYGYELPKDIEYVYTHVRKTHNSGVFDTYTDEMKRARKSGILTGGWVVAGVLP